MVESLGGHNDIVELAVKRLNDSEKRHLDAVERLDELQSDYARKIEIFCANPETFSQFAVRYLYEYRDFLVEEYLRDLGSRMDSLDPVKFLSEYVGANISSQVKFKDARYCHNFNYIYGAHCSHVNVNNNQLYAFLRSGFSYVVKDVVERRVEVLRNRKCRCSFKMSDYTSIPGQDPVLVFLELFFKRTGFDFDKISLSDLIVKFRAFCLDLKEPYYVEDPYFKIVSHICSTNVGDLPFKKYRNAEAGIGSLVDDMIYRLSGVQMDSGAECTEEEDLNVARMSGIEKLDAVKAALKVFMIKLGVNKNVLAVLGDSDVSAKAVDKSDAGFFKYLDDEFFKGGVVSEVKKYSGFFAGSKRKRINKTPDNKDIENMYKLLKYIHGLAELSRVYLVKGDDRYKRDGKIVREIVNIYIERFKMAVVDLEVKLSTGDFVIGNDITEALDGLFDLFNGDHLKAAIGSAIEGYARLQNLDEASVELDNSLD